jgi:glycerophosphoryl diester phosphodiesterase
MSEFETQAMVIAHRGASAYAPENTFAAFDLGLALGAHSIELDLRMTADGELITAHDPTLARTAGDPRPVSQLRREDLLALAPELRPLLLDAVLDRYGRSARYCIDLKPSGTEAERRLIRAIRRHGLRDHVVVQSFSEVSLRRIRALDPGLPLVRLLSDDLTGGQIARATRRAEDFAVGIGPAATTVDEQLIGLARSLELTVQPYTVNDEDEMRRLLALGVDGIFTDAPDRLLRVLAAERESLVRCAPAHDRRVGRQAAANARRSLAPHGSDARVRRAQRLLALRRRSDRTQVS